MPFPFDELPPGERLRALQRVLAGMAALPEADQRLLVARFVDQRSVAELARECGESKAVVEARLERALARLRSGDGASDDEREREAGDED